MYAINAGAAGDCTYVCEGCYQQGAMLQPPKQADVTYSAGAVDPIAPLRAALKGHYEIEREIGQGAFATVYLARDLKHERKVAIKVLNADPTSETGELRFIREIRMLARLQHPNILPLHDSGHVEALLYYVMPYVSGDTLRDRIDRQKQLPMEAACSIARDVADALAYAHAQGVIHRDIKPENILLSTGHPILADFGIARAIDLAGVRQLTRTGMGSPGTPAYMSPEQLLGTQELDGRSDTYSLGCVLFEMLTGKPPFAGKDGFVKRFTEAPPNASSLRPGLAKSIDDTIARALQRDPSLRFPTAQDFATALGADAAGLSRPQSTQLEPTEATEAHLDRRGWLERARERSTAVIVGAALVALVIALWVIPKPTGGSGMFGGVAIDSTRYVILPLTMSGQPDKSQLGRQVADRLYDAFSQWDKLPVVPDTRVSQVLAGRTAALSESDALSVARSLGAGMLVWGQVSGTTNAARVSVHLYDVPSGESRDSFLFLDTTSDARVYAPASFRLLGGRGRPREAAGGDGLTKSYPAWLAYGRGHQALKDWDLDGAERYFKEAVASDGAFTPARIWLAQLLAWRSGYRGDEWRVHSVHGTPTGQPLTIRDRTVASALSAMRDGDYTSACSAFRTLTVTDSLDFTGWYGLGDCQWLDSSVVRYPASPSGWRFRSSYHSAAHAYMRAIAVNPGGVTIFPFERLKTLLPTAPTQVRSGKGPPPNRVLFVAYPGTMGDSLLFIPYELSAFQKLSARATSPTQYRALARDAAILREYANSWIRQSPKSARAYEAYADVLETSGDILGNADGTASALGALRRAREYSTTPDEKTRVAAREAWVDVKSFRFAEGRLLADSILDGKLGAQLSDAHVSAGLAALTGKLGKTSTLVAQSREWMPAVTTDIPDPIEGVAAKFFAFSALGVCRGEYAGVERDLDERIATYVAESERDALSEQIKARPLSMISPCDGAQSATRIRNPSGRVPRAQQAYAKGNAVMLRDILDTAIADLRIRRPGDLSYDYTFQIAWLRAASGDSAGALRQLDVALSALPSVSTSSLGWVATAGGAIRAMVLCSDLADAQHDRKTAIRWAKAVVDLWQNADPQLQPEVGRLRERLARR